MHTNDYLGPIVCKCMDCASQRKQRQDREEEWNNEGGAVYPDRASPEWRCTVCGTEWSKSPVIAGTIGCPECGTLEGEE